MALDKNTIWMSEKRMSLPLSSGMMMMMMVMSPWSAAVIAGHVTATGTGKCRSKSGQPAWWIALRPGSTISCVSHNFCVISRTFSGGK